MTEMPGRPLDALADARMDEFLRRSARTIEYPTVSPLRPRVFAALEAEAQRMPRRWGGLVAPRAAVAAGVLVLVLLVATLALPGARSAVADFFGVLPGQRIEVLPPATATLTTPTASAEATYTQRPAPTPTPTPQYPSWIRAHALAVTLAQAQDAVDFPIVTLPDTEPDAVYVVMYQEQPLVILLYLKFDLWQTLGSGWFGKSLPYETVIEQFQIDGRSALWVSGDLHETAFFDVYGREVLGSRRTVDRNTLIWMGEHSYLRLETELPLEEAQAIAERLESR